MPRFEENLFGLVRKQDLLQIGYDVTRPNDPVDQLIGDVKTDNIIAYWETIASQYNLPVMAQFHSFDVEAQKTLRIPVDLHNIEKGLIKVKIDQSERLQALMARGVVDEDKLYDRVLDDGYNLSEQVFTRTKVAKNELLATGKVTIKENNLDITVDYGVPAANLNKTLDFGAGAAKAIDEQLLDLTEAAEAAGRAITGIYTSKAMLNKLRKDASLQADINGTSMAGKLLSRAALEAFLNNEFGIKRVLINDLHYSKPLTMGANGRPVVTDVRYYPVDKITFFAGDGTIADGLWGDPPEVVAANFMKQAGVSASEVSPYVYVTQYAEADPAIVWTKASGLFMPALYDPNSLYVATATETPGT